MSRADYALAFLTLFAVVLGAALTTGIELARGQLERKQRRQDRRDDFERATLIELRDELVKLVRAAGAVWWEDRAAYRQQQTKDWDTLPRSNKRRQEAGTYQDIDFRLDALRECAR